jgi:hypothetical protein
MVRVLSQQRARRMSEIQAKIAHVYCELYEREPHPMPARLERLLRQLERHDEKKSSDENKNSNDVQ